MTFFKRAAAAALCVVMLAGSTLPAFAEEGGASIIVEPGSETSVIDPGSADSGETSIIDTGSGETTIVDPDGGENPKDAGRSNLDVSDEQYSQINLSRNTQWDGKTKMESGTNYYIEGRVAPRQNFTIPKESRLVVKSGAQLVLYKNRAMNVRGIITVEPEAELIDSETHTIYEKAGIENYGGLKGGVSSAYRV